jgi:hypothetical protein
MRSILKIKNERSKGTELKEENGIKEGRSLPGKKHG